MLIRICVSAVAFFSPSEALGFSGSITISVCKVHVHPDSNNKVAQVTDSEDAILDEPLFE